MATQVNLQFNVEGASIVDLRNQLKDLKNAMSEATDPEEMTRLAKAAGEVKDRMKDVNEQMNEFAAGSDFEKVTNNIGGIKAGLRDLDFGKVSASVTNLANNIKTIDLKSITSGIGDMGKAFGALGKALLTNPLFLMGSIVAIIVAILAKLGVFKKLFEDIGKFADQIWSGIEKIAEKIGLVEKKETEYQKKQRERAEAAMKAQDEEKKAIIETASGYVGLIYQLKVTNQGSAERKKLIDEINKKYGTTLKNLKDETQFQNQLNLSVKEYIALSVLKVRQAQKEKEQKAAIEELIKAEDERNKVLQEYRATVKENGEVVSEMSEQEISDYDLKKYGVSAYNTALTMTADKLKAAQAEAEKYAISSADLQAEIDKLGFKTPTTTTPKEDKPEKDEQKEKNKEYLDALSDRNEAEEDLTKRIIEKKIDLMKAGADKEKADRQARFDEEKKRILEDSIKSDIDLLEKQFENKAITQQQFDQKLNDLKLNADKNLNDKETELLKLATDQLNRDLQKIESDELNRRKLATLEFQKENAKTLTEQKDIEIQIIKEATNQAIQQEGLSEEQISNIRRKSVNDIALLEEEKLKILQDAANIKKATNISELTNVTDNAKAELDLAKEGTDEKIKLLGIYTAALIAQLEAERNAKLASLDEELYNLNVKKSQAEQGIGIAISETELARIKQLEQEKKNIQDEFRRTKIDLDSKAEEEIDKIRKSNIDGILEDINEYAGQVGNVISDLSQIQNNIFEVQQNRMAARHAEQLKGLDEESDAYKNLKKQQATEEEELQRKIFEANKKQQIASAIVQGVQATLNAYSSGSAIPVIGPVMGPIFAAIAAGVAATNIAKIKSSTFGGAGAGEGSTGTSTSPDTTSAANDAAQPLIQMFGQGNDANTETFGKPKSAPTFNVIATVSETDMTATQKRVAAMQANAEL